MCLTHHRDQLKTGQSRTYYSIIYDAVKGNTPLTRIPLPVLAHGQTVNDAFHALWAVLNDHPEIFYIDSRAQAQTTADGLFLNLNPLYSPAQIRRMRKVMDRRIRCLTAGVAHLPVWDREKIVYERIRRSLSYENRHKKYDHNIVGPLMQGIGVCQGFSHLVILAMRRVGIPCIYVSGKAKPEDAIGHAWNLVWVEGKAYHLDVTWEYVHENSALAYAYFNLTDDQIRADHLVVDTEGLPPCDDPRYGYHSHSGTLFRTQEDLTAYLKQAFQTGDGPFSVRMAAPCDVHQTMNAIIGSLPWGYYRYTTFHAQSTALIWRESPK